MVNAASKTREGRLSHIAVGARALVRAVLEPGSLGERLLEMGLTPGTEVRIIRRGLRGDPIQLVVRGTMLSLRRAQADNIGVDALG